MQMKISRFTANVAEQQFGDAEAAANIQKTFKLYSVNSLNKDQWLLGFDNEQAFNEFAGLMLILSLPVPKWYDTMHRVSVTLNNQDMLTLYDMFIRKG